MEEKIKENGGGELTIFFVLFFFLCLFLRSPPAQFLFFDPFLFVLVLLSARVLRCINDEPSLPSYALDNCSQDRFLSPFPTPLQFFGSVCDGKGGWAMTRDGIAKIVARGEGNQANCLKIRPSPKKSFGRCKESRPEFDPDFSL